jgi:hypothetical protein
MAFGKMIEQVQVAQVSNSAQFNGFNPFLSQSEGKRVIRFLPDTADKNQPLLGPTVLHVWITVQRNGAPTKRRIFIDPKDRYLLSESEQKEVRSRFFMNVYDRTPVIKLENGSLVYPNGEQKFLYKQDGKVLEAQGKPVRNNQIMIFEGSVSSGKGQNGLLNDIEAVSRTIFDDDNNLIPLTMVDLNIVTIGSGLQTKRTVFPGTNRDPLPEEALTCQIYDLESFAKPYPAECIKHLKAGADYADVMKEYNIAYMPKLIDRPTAPVQAQMVMEEEEDSLF